MKMSGRITSCCVPLFLTLTSVSAIQKLNSINDLKRIDFGQSVPIHSLLLLHWFANVVDIDNNNVIHLTFDPNSGDYGSHHYGNYEQLLDPLPRGNIRYRYYTVGNLNQNSPMQLPDYVVHSPAQYEGRNRDRIIFRVREQTTGWQALQTIDRVYLSQHYDPAHTYEITSNLLREIMQFSVGEDQQSLSELRDRFGSNVADFQLRHIRNTWGNLACLGLLLLIVIQKGYYPNQPNFRPQHATGRNTDTSLFSNFSENRLNHGCVILLILLFVIWLFCNR